jgi:hypothetical protein
MTVFNIQHEQPSLEQVLYDILCGTPANNSMAIEPGHPVAEPPDSVIASLLALMETLATAISLYFMDSFLLGRDHQATLSITC